MALQDYYYGSSPYLDYHMDFATVWARGQWFQATASYDVTSIEIYVRRFSGPAAPGTVTVAICTVDGSNLPNEILASGTFNGNSLYTSYTWQSVFLTASLTSGTKYCITVIPSAWGLVWAGDNSPAYTGCTQWDSDGGPTWNTSETGSDQRFRIYGDALPEKPINPTPTNNDTETDFSNLTLSWEDGGDADTFDVYIGETGNLTKVSSAQAGVSYITTLNELGTIFGASPINQKIYWRIDATNGVGTTQGDEWNFDPRPAKVTSLTPANEAENIQLNDTTGSWEAPSANIDSYDVYFGTSEESIALVNDTAELELALLDTPFQNYGTTYYWRVDSVNDFGIATGDVLSFTTLAFDPVLPTGITLVGGEPTGTPTGENNMITVRKLVAAANSKIWYEDI